MVSISDASEKLRRFKRDLVADLFLQRGTLWEYVQRVRTELGISSAVQIPEPVETRAHYPGSWEQLGQLEQQFLRGAWLNLTHALRNEIVPEIYRLPLSPVDWTAFISASLLYDPPESQLLAFARLGDDWLASADADERVLDHATERSSDAPVLPIVRLPDPFRARDDAHWYRDTIIDEIGKQFLEPRGLDIWEMYHAVIWSRGDYEGEESSIGLEYAQRQLDNELRPYIFVTEETTVEDVKKAFRSIK